MLNGVKHTIIGVAPQGFYGTFVGYSFQFWVPASMEEVFERMDYKLENRGARWIEGFVVLKPGVTIEQAQAEMSAVAQRLETAFPDTNRGRGVRFLRCGRPPSTARERFANVACFAGGGCFVLLIACANVGNLLLVRSLARRREMTVRLSIGAGRFRLLRQLLTEGLILSAAAAAGGLLLANLARNAIVLLYPTRPGVIANLPAEIDPRVLALSAGVCLISTVLFGLIPAVQASPDRSRRGHGIRFRQRRWRSRAHLDSIQPGGGSGVAEFCPAGGRRHLAQESASHAIQRSGFLHQRHHHRRRHGFGRLRCHADPQFSGSTGGSPAIHGRSRVGGLDAPRSVQLRNILLVSGCRDGFVAQPGEQPVIEYSEIGPAWLATMGIPLVSGREFTRADNETARSVAVVNEAMAVQYWRGEDPLGKRVQVKGRWAEVVGVAKNSKYRSLIEPMRPFLYLPMRQSLRGQSLEIRSRLGPEAMAHALTREIQAIDANLAPSEVITMREQVDRMSWSQRAAVTLLANFSLIALLLAAIGLLWGNVVRGFAKLPRAGAPHGAGRAGVGFAAPGDDARVPSDRRRHGAGRVGRTGFHQITG